MPRQRIRHRRYAHRLPDERILDRLYADFDEYEFEELVADLLKALASLRRGV